MGIGEEARRRAVESGGRPSQTTHSGQRGDGQRVSTELELDLGLDPELRYAGASEQVSSWSGLVGGDERNVRDE